MSEQDIIKEYGDVLLEASHITDNPPPVISIGPKIDMALGGGVPEGSLVIFAGIPKAGKTISALTFCRNAQKVLIDKKPRKIYFGNIEGRIKKRDLEGIQDLDLNPDIFKIVGSTRGNILSGENYLSIFDKVIHNEPHAVGVIDSFSALAAEKEMTNEIGDADVAPIHKFLAKFTRRFANVLPINRVTLVGITHLMANIQKFGHGKKRIEKSGTALQYAQDVKLMTEYFKPLMQGETQIGQKVEWTIHNSSLGPPGQKVVSIIKYGVGIWNEYEVAELLKEFGIAQGKSWLKIEGIEQKFQGLTNLAVYLEENPIAYSDFKTQAFEMVGVPVYEN